MLVHLRVIGRHSVAGFAILLVIAAMSMHGGKNSATSSALECDGTNAQCSDEKIWEKITCHNPSTCFDAHVYCKSWNVCDCCSAEPLNKCLLPTAETAFAPECSGRDGRQWCCGDSVTHKRTTDVEDAIKAGGVYTAEMITEGAQRLEEFMETQHNPCADLNLLSEAEKADCPKA